MAMKPRILYLMQFLEQHSDEKHPVTTAEILKDLEKKGCLIFRRILCSVHWIPC